MPQLSVPELTAVAIPAKTGGRRQGPVVTASTQALAGDSHGCRSSTATIR